MTLPVLPVFVKIELLHRIYVQPLNENDKANNELVPNFLA